MTTIVSTLYKKWALVLLRRGVTRDESLRSKLMASIATWSTKVCCGDESHSEGAGIVARSS